MQLTDEQRQQVTEWINTGLRLSEIQDKMAADFGLRMTYMDARLLVDDLRLTPKDPVVEAPQKPVEPATHDIPDEDLENTAGLLDEPAAAGGGKVSISVDTVTRPGAMVSGKAGFSDGQAAEWYLDQYGRFGLVPAQEGYRPSQADVAALQKLLDAELTKLGY